MRYRTEVKDTPLSELDLQTIREATEASALNPTIKSMIADLLKENNEGVNVTDYPRNHFSLSYLVNNFFEVRKLPYELRMATSGSPVYRLFIVERKEMNLR